MKLFAALAAALMLAPAAIQPAAAADDVVAALQKTPVSAFSYGLVQLSGTARAILIDDPQAPAFSPPLAGRLGDLTTVVYRPATGRIYITLVKVEKLADGATPDEACRQAFAGIRAVAGLDPQTGAPPEGMDASLFAGAFELPGMDDAALPEGYRAALDQKIELRYSGLAGQRFVCHAPLLGTSYVLE
jgi:hypothetical protein